MAAENAEVEIEDEDDFEIEIEDDTPEEDRGRPLAADDTNDDPDDNIDDEELAQYSAGAAKRIKTLTKKRHDERRAKEAAKRELNEAVAEVQKLRTYLATATKTIVTKDKTSISADLETTKKQLSEAIELGDGAKVADLTEKVSDLKQKLGNAERVEKEIVVQQPRDEGDPADQSNWPKARRTWYKNNQDWFHKDKAMTGFVYGLHQQLIEDGVAPDSEEYFDEINRGMKKTFPNYFKESDDVDDDDTEEERPAPRRAEPRAAAPKGNGGAVTKKGGKKVIKLTKSQVALCERLGITPKQYIEEQMKIGD